jgi:DNA-binding MarR family transcriptional regulator
MATVVLCLDYSLRRLSFKNEGNHMYFKSLSESVEVAFGSTELDHLARSIWQTHSDGGLSDSEAQELAERVASRRMPLRGARKLKDGHSLISAIPQARFKNRGYRLSESLQRRKRLAFSGPLPPAIAAHFTIAELAALRIIGDDVRARGRCDACNDEIAARAGISRSSAKNAVREAVRLGMLSREERRYRGRRSDPNVLTIISREWLAWLHKAGRGQNRDHQGYKIKNKAQSESGQTCGRVTRFTVRSVPSTGSTLQSGHGSSARISQSGWPHECEERSGLSEN